MLSEEIYAHHSLNGSDEEDAENYDLESQLSGRRESEREIGEGEDADLTEVAAPAPIDRTYTQRNSLEEEETKARRQQTRSSQGDEAGLTEIAAPEPVELRQSRPSTDEEKAHDVHSPPAESSNDEDLCKTAEEEPGYSHAATELYTHSYLIFFSIMGTLARLGTEAITAYPNAPFISPVLWANMAGCFFIGLLTEDRRLFRQEWGVQSEEWSFHHSKIDDADEEKLKSAQKAHVKVKKTIPLFIGLAVGFCGSYTSFSSFLRDAFLAAIDQLKGTGAGSNSGVLHQTNRKGGYGFEAAMAVLMIQLAVSLAALNVGATTASALDRWMPTLPFSFIRHLLDPLIVVAGFGCWIGAVIMSIWPVENVWRGQVTFVLVFAPVGCLLRFHMSKALNARLPSFPLGTFHANIIGTAVLGICYDLQHSTISGTVTGCQVLEGVMEGFCGCLTTVSTFVLEIDTLRRRHAYTYGLTSVFVAMSFQVVIIGTLDWTRGLAKPACSI